MKLQIKIVLVEPLYQGNVGSVARVMKNFGFYELVLVNPCKLKGEARAMSSHAREILENAKIINTFNEAINDVSLVVGTTGMTSSKDDEHIRTPAYTPSELKNKLEGKNGTVAILFGREDNGFTNDELKSCDMIIHIPANDEYSVMNISHSVAVILYELSSIQSGEKSLAEPFDMKLLYEHLKELLEQIEYPAHKKDKTLLMFRRVFGRAQLTNREVQTLRGVLRIIQRRMK
ncbi:MAG: RNA methyltransferase [Methanohalobium sp.]|uniref:RNA methyltransferase n=1 Tax=Methanohalobium sp. TaxID=2837493 RepID=UPI00397C2A20